ncbi:MAG: FadR/GntR family transcriptional regulator [Alphaproteobacteria bacterium]
MAERRFYHTVAENILELIDSGFFPVGHRLPSERDLAVKFDVSRVSVREALIVLQAHGRIDVKVGSGAYVLDGSRLPINGLPKVGPFELTEARVLFEAESAALAAPIITDETIQELEGYIEIMSGKPDGTMSADDADAAFHNAIARATNNQAIIFVIDSMWKMRSKAAQLQKVYRDVCDNDPSHREDEHLAILKALRNRDSGAARRTMRAHFTRIIVALLEDSEKEAFQQAKHDASASRSRFLLTQKLK